MATRACIAMPKGKSWVGVYSHWDGYPAGLGNVLWNLLERRYGFEAQRAWKELILDNPNGWSSLNCFHGSWGDPELVLRWDGAYKITVDEEQRMRSASGDACEAIKLPVSYQNDVSRSGEHKSPPLTPRNCGQSWVEYVYVIHPDRLEIWQAGDSLDLLAQCLYATGRPAAIFDKEAA